MDRAREIIDEALKNGRAFLLETEAKKLVSLYGIAVPRFRLTRSLEEALQFSHEIGFPVVIKIVSPDIIHKSDVGGVMLNISSPRELKERYKSLKANVRKHLPNIRIKGVLVEEMAKPGVEVVIGSIRDPQFGPTIMFGLGGVFIEVLRDVSFRVAPINMVDAYEMMSEIRGRKLLNGYRNLAPRDKKILANFLVSASKLMMENEEINQLDLNPIVAYDKGAIVLDARVILEKSSRNTSTK